MRGKQERELSLVEKKIRIAGRMGENDARRGKDRKDFSRVNKSLEYIRSYTEGYDRIASQKQDIHKRQASKSLSSKVKRAKISPVSMEAPAEQKIKNLPSKKEFLIAGFVTTLANFLRRNYMFQDTQEEVSREDLYEGVLSEDGTITVNGRLIQWDTKRNTGSLDTFIKIGQENPITVDGFLRRTYVFKDTGEVVKRSVLKTAEIHEDGTVTVNGKLIERKTRVTTKERSDLLRIGKEKHITKGAFLRRTYVFKDTGEVVDKGVQKTAVIHDDGTVTVNGRLIQWESKRKDGALKRLIKVGQEKPITMDAFIKRLYVFKDTGERVDKESLKTVETHGDGTVTVNGKLIEREKDFRPGLMQLGKGKTITNGYDTPQSLGSDEFRPLIPETPSESGGVSQIVGPFIERNDIEENFSLSSKDYDILFGLGSHAFWELPILERPSASAEVSQMVSPFIERNDREENFSLSSSGYDVPSDSGSHAFLGLPILEFSSASAEVSQMVSPLIERNDKEEASSLSSDVDLSFNPALYEFLGLPFPMPESSLPSVSFEGMDNPPEEHHCESEETQTVDLNGMGSRPRKEYSPHFFQSFGKSPKVCPTLSDGNMSLGSDKEHDRDETTLHSSSFLQNS